MATSGTIATTSIDTATVLEHAFRRVKVKSSDQTPEYVSIARDNLYLLLLGMSTRGLNLWCVTPQYIGLQAHTATYVMPAGTLDVLNVVYSMPSVLSSTFAANGTGGTATLTTSSNVLRIGFQPSAGFTGAVAISTSTDGITYTQQLALPSATYTSGTWYWNELPNNGTALSAQIAGTGLSLTSIRLANQIADLPVTPWSRDTYSVINNKNQEASPSTSYYLEKFLTPQITLWPVPNTDANHLTVFTHRQVQDVGTLTQQLELPQRWVESTIWQLAIRLALEIDVVDPGILSVIQPLADKALEEAELGESDGAPFMLAPNIRGYSA